MFFKGLFGQRGFFQGPVSGRSFSRIGQVFQLDWMIGSSDIGQHKEIVLLASFGTYPVK